MSASTKILKAAAGTSAASGTVTVDQAFSTFLYTGNATTRNIQNGIDLTEGGLVWTKARSNADYHVLYDTERGTSVRISANDADGNTTDTNEITAFNSNGYTLNSAGGFTNDSPTTYVSWTFRKAPKFFDCISFVGNDVAGRQISHSLNSEVGMVVIKNLTDVDNWMVWHRNLNAGTSPENYYIRLNLSNTEVNDTRFTNGTAPTSSVFSVSGHSSVNGNGKSYIAYIFADNSSEDAADQMIKCGSYTGNGTTNHVTLGFEPQWIMVKCSSNSSTHWQIYDKMRGVTNGDNDPYLRANTSDTELGAGSPQIRFTSTGFELQSNWSNMNRSGYSYIFMAIRAPMMAEITDATEAFDLTSITGNGANGRKITTSNVSDLIFGKGRNNTSYDWALQTRLTGSGKYLKLHETGAEGTNSNARVSAFDHSDGYEISGSAFNNSGSPTVLYNFTRAKGVHDQVCYTGTGSATTQAHSLGAVPEMIIIRARSAEGNWVIYHKGMNGGTNPAQYYAKLPTTSISQSATVFNDTAPTDSVFSVGTNSWTNGSSVTYLALLFGTVAGVSKVGYFTHGASDTSVDCGFSNGARFIFIRQTDASRSHYIFDTAQGIVAGNDPYLIANEGTAQVTNTDFIDPLSSGFILTSNMSAGDYIFLAMA